MMMNHFGRFFSVGRKKTSCSFPRGERLAWQARAFLEREAKGKSAKKRGLFVVVRPATEGLRTFLDKQWPAVSILLVYQYT